MLHTYFGNSQSCVCITRPAPWRESVTGKKSFNAFSVCVKHWSKEEKQISLEALVKQPPPQQPESGCLFRCLITGVNWCKIRHNKQANKVLFRASIHYFYR